MSEEPVVVDAVVVDEPAPPQPAPPASVASDSLTRSRCEPSSQSVRLGVPGLTRCVWAVGSWQKRSSSCGKTCALVTAGLLVACGIVVLVFAMMHLNLPATLVEDTCTKSMAGVVRPS